MTPEEQKLQDCLTENRKLWERFLLRAVLSIVLVVGFFGVLVYMLSQDLKGADTLLAVLPALVIGVVQWNFGGSASSERKTELLSRAPAIDE